MTNPADVDPATIYRRPCRRCKGSYWTWQTVLEHEPDCLYRREAEAAIHAAALAENEKRDREGGLA